MPYQSVNGAKIYYEEHGEGAETILFSHGFLWSGSMFQEQVNALKNRYHCITYDHRGQGKSEVTRSGYNIENVYQDALALIEALNCAPCHFVGLSMGGFVGLRLAIRRPDQLKSLILIESSAEPEASENLGSYRLLGLVARWLGLEVVADRVMEIMFGSKFRNDPARADLMNDWKQHLLANDRIGATRALAGVVDRGGVSVQLGDIKIPTLILVGDQDVATPLPKAEKMHQGISGSQLVIIPGAGHTSTVEEPAAVTAAIESFLDGLAAK